jgi:hypothetical protein
VKALTRRDLLLTTSAAALTIASPALAFKHGSASAPIPTYTGKIFGYYFIATSPRGYTQADYAADIAEAQAVGLDGFCIGFGSLDTQYTTWISTMVAAIQAASGNFCFCFSIEAFNASAISVSQYQNIVTTYQGTMPVGGTGVSSTGYYWYNGAPVITGDNGGTYDASYWSSIYSGGFSGSFFPGWTIANASGGVQAGNPTTTDLNANYSTYSGTPDVVGWFNFTFGGLYSPDYLLTTELDFATFLAGKSLAYMCGINSYYAQGALTNQYIAAYEQYGLQGIRQQWTPIVNGTFTPPIIIICTWTDESESYSTPCPVSDFNVNFGAWGPLKPHIGFAQLHYYFIKWLKAGAQPTPTIDEVFVAYRVTPASLTPSAISISSITWSGGTATATTSSALDPAFQVGQGNLPWTIAGVSLSGYNGAQTVHITGSSTFTFPVASNPGGTGTGGTATQTQTPLFYSYLIDQISVVTILTTGRTLEVIVNGTTNSYSVPAGYTETLVAFVPGTVEIKLLNGGTTLVDIVGENIVSSLPYYDTNPWTGYAHYP